jgi:alpha-tubulin suppressor-like RCC1 family protein
MFTSRRLLVAFAVLATIGCKGKKLGGGGLAADDAKLGTVVCWGLGRSGQIGNGKNDDSNKPTTVAGVDDATKLFLGSIMSCARVPAGLRCWGDTRSGDSSNVPRPFELVPDADAVASSTLFTCALRKTGAVACWGSNIVGQLGNGKAPAPATSVKIAVKAAKGGGLDIQAADPLPANFESKTPVAVTNLTDATAIALGGSHACALRRGGEVVCWGSNSVGQLGDGKGGYNQTSDRPVSVTGLTGVLEIAAGQRVTCARTSETVSCWGTLSEQYPRDNSQPVLLPSPTKVDGLPSTVELAVRETQACARTATGDVWCWGPSGKPVASRVKHVSQLVAGSSHICARLESGSVTCWGEDNNGQLGRSDEAPPSDTVRGVTNVVDVAAGGGHTCVLRKAAK